MNEGLLILTVLPLLGIVGFSMYWYFSRANSILERWAEDNSFELLSAEYRHFFHGPFFWNTSKGQAVYYVRVRTTGGDVRSGWVRCGGFFMGLFSDVAEVRWED